LRRRDHVVGAFVAQQQDLPLSPLRNGPLPIRRVRAGQADWSFADTTAGNHLTRRFCFEPSDTPASPLALPRLQTCMRRYRQPGYLPWLFPGA
jgi:hypothetical protein